MTLYALTSGVAQTTFGTQVAPSGIGELVFNVQLNPSGGSVVMHIEYPKNTLTVGQIWPRYRESA